MALFYASFPFSQHPFIVARISGHDGGITENAHCYGKPVACYTLCSGVDTLVLAPEL